MTKLSQQDIKDVKEKYPNINPELLETDAVKTARQIAVSLVQPSKRRSKYNAVPTTYNGVVYASKKEAIFAQKLDLRLKAGELDYVLRQVPFDLGAGIIYRADFVTLKNQGMRSFWVGEKKSIGLWEVTVYEVKGMETPAWKLKHKLFKDKYPLIALEVV